MDVVSRCDTRCRYIEVNDNVKAVDAMIKRQNSEKTTSYQHGQEKNVPALLVTGRRGWEINLAVYISRIKYGNIQWHWRR